MNTVTTFKLRTGQVLEFISQEQTAPGQICITLNKPKKGPYVKVPADQQKKRGRPFGAKGKPQPQIHNNNVREAVAKLDQAKQDEIKNMFLNLGLDYYADQVLPAGEVNLQPHEFQ